MLVYFVRHGQTTFNAERRTQHGQTELSELGIEQAKLLAKRLRNIPFQAILSSDFTRAAKTAEIIAEQLAIKTITHHAHLQEHKRPTVLEGIEFSDPQWINVNEQIKKNIHDPEWHYADEENHWDLYQRAKTAISEISKLDYESVLVVTHGGTLRAMLYAVLFPDHFDGHLFEHLFWSFKTENTSISVFELLDNKKWRVISWNDHSHLTSSE